MVKLRKKEIKDGVVYYYQIEGAGEWGELFLDTKNNQNGWNKLAEGDDADYDRWRQKAYMKMRQFVKENANCLKRLNKIDEAEQVCENIYTELNGTESVQQQNRAFVYIENLYAWISNYGNNKKTIHLS